MNKQMNDEKMVNAEAQDGEAKQIFELQRVYVKDITVQLVDQTETFLLKWEPKVNFELKAENRELKEPNYYEVSLDSTIKISIADKEIGTIKVIQAGIFRVEGLDAEAKKMVLNGHCQDLLYPYLCSQISRITVDAGFPSLQMRPMSFIALYQQNLAQHEGEEKK